MMRVDNNTERVDAALELHYHARRETARKARINEVMSIKNEKYECLGSVVYTMNATISTTSATWYFC
jgi:hypothetical protein